MDHDQFLKTFLSESQENLELAEHSLLHLESHPDDSQEIDTVYRAMHTIKGGAGFFALENLQKLVHAAETLLGAIRDKAVAIHGKPMEALLNSVDTIREGLAHIEQNGKEPPSFGKDLTAVLTSLLLEEPVAFNEAFGIFEEDSPAPSTIQRVPEATAPSTISPAESTIRVNTASLGHLMDLVGELVLRRNEILNLTSRHATPLLSSACQRLNRITSDLQESVMQLRMQPIATIWNQYPRILRDLAHTCGKSITLRMEGQETELDKTILEAVKDPLIHLVRNAIDHGIEPPQERLQAGKNKEGNFVLLAGQEQGQVILEVSDDGRGLNLPKIKQKAVERGFLKADQAAALSDKDAARLIFLPGLSTAESVTNISGRGVGMDVVKSSIEKVGGTIDVETAAGKGTCFRIKIPLTLAIIPALMVRSGTNSYAIPNVNLLEVLRQREGSNSLRIERLNEHNVLHLRGELLPVLRLQDILKEAPQTDTNTFCILILQAVGRTFGMAVESVEEIQEIVVKPLSFSLRSIPIYTGVTIKPDGSVALILDVQTLSNHASFILPNASTEPHEQFQDLSSKPTFRRLLLVRARDNLTVAIPLEKVARLERLPSHRVELTAEGMVVQYRSTIIPIVRIDQFLGDDPVAPSKAWARDEISLVVHRIQNSDVGVAVDMIIDIVEAEVNILRSSTSRFVSGSTIIRNRVTEVLNMDAVYAAIGVKTETTHG